MPRSLPGDFDAGDVDLRLGFSFKVACLEMTRPCLPEEKGVDAVDKIQCVSGRSIPNQIPVFWISAWAPQGRMIAQGRALLRPMSTLLEGARQGGTVGPEWPISKDAREVVALFFEVGTAGLKWCASSLERIFHVIHSEGRQSRAVVAGSHMESRSWMRCRLGLFPVSASLIWEARAGPLDRDSRLDGTLDRPAGKSIRMEPPTGEKGA